MKKSIIFYSVLLSIFSSELTSVYGQEKALMNTSESKYAAFTSVNLTDVTLTDGFWAERFNVCQNSMIPHMMEMYMNDSISHGFANFEIAAGLKEGEHIGPPFHDGDFYKLLEAMIVANVTVKDPKIDKQIDSIITIIGETQREDGYIHTPVVIEQRHDTTGKKEFGERLDFETYNMGHLMTTACLHYRLTGKTQLLDIAKKATDFLYNYYKDKTFELAQNAICPSHYMGVTEMYRTTKDPRYYELAKGLVDIRDMVKDGTDHNQDRTPFRLQVEAQGHAVRANYLYAGAADVYLETGEDSLLMAMENIWDDLVNHKLYITGACGALYDGVSPNGTTYDQPSIQQVHQAYGEKFQLPNITAHNESCANIGNLMWNWRMLQATGEAKYADIIETVMYNSLLGAISLDGLRHFYTNPLAVSNVISPSLRWSKDREEYITFCNCCPPNTIRTIAEISNYFYGHSDKGLWIHQYGSSTLNTTIKDKGELKLTQKTDYPWDGEVNISIDKAPKKEFSVFLRIPGWAKDASVQVNGETIDASIQRGSYVEINRKWKKGDEIALNIPMTVMLMQSNPLVEENRNQVAVQRGPVVYCLEQTDLPKGESIYDVVIPSNIELKPEKITIANSQITALKGEALRYNNDHESSLYSEISDNPAKKQTIRLVPYYAWDNRGPDEMTIWLPLTR